MASFKNNDNDIVRYADLLTRAHEEGLTSIETEILQMPSEANNYTAIVRAVARGERGEYSGIGDANRESCHEMVAPHYIRVAETRAKARAVKDLLGWTTPVLEELGGQHGLVLSNESARWESDPITDGQRRMLWRKAVTLGHQGEEALEFLTREFGKPPAEVTKMEASRMIDRLERLARHRANGSRPHG